MIQNFNLSIDVPIQENISCDLKDCGCRVNSFIWVSDHLQTIYFETPKAACSSIKYVLDIYTHANFYARAVAYALLNKHKFKIQKKNHLKKSRLSDFYDLVGKEKKDIINSNNVSNTTVGAYSFKMFYGTPEEAIKKYPEYFSFTVVRHPVQRIISAWKMFCASGNKFREKQIKKMYGKKAQNINLEFFINKLFEIRNHHWHPYHFFIPHNDIALVDFVANFENLNEDWRFIADKLRITDELPRKNSSGSQRPHLNSEMYNYILQCYNKDCQLFDYK